MRHANGLFLGAVSAILKECVAGRVWRTLLAVGAGIALLVACSGGESARSGLTDSHPEAGAAGQTGAVLPSGSGGSRVITNDSDASTGTQTTPTALTVSPSEATIVVTMKNGAVTSTAVQNGSGSTVLFSALDANTGASVAAVWSFDRGELGSIASSGEFSASGTYAGTGHAKATYGALTGSAVVHVVIRGTNNGAAPGTDPGKDTDYGGVGGVGGVAFGSAVDTATLARLTGDGASPSTAKLQLLYPYDKTVWPRGLLPPLLQWSSNVQATSVLIHLVGDSFEFTGTYAGSGLTKQLIEADAWKMATYSNEGEQLKVELKIDDGTKTYGPVTEAWSISRSVLQGTVYYDSYNTQVATYDSSGYTKGSVLAIKPGARNPNVAIASTDDACHVCHSVSADGSTIVMQGPGIPSKNPPTLDNTQVFSLKDTGQPLIQFYPGDGADSDKFDWAALYPDGTMALSHSGDGYHSWQGDSKLFKLSDGTEIQSKGFTNLVTKATMPAFSPDGRHLAFTFCSGTGTSAVQPNWDSHVLALMDFDCGAPTGGVTCDGSTYAFSNLRVLHNDTGHALGWPSFLPDGQTVIFHKALQTTSIGGSNLYSWQGGMAQLWAASVPDAGGVGVAVELAALNGDGYLPTGDGHEDDAELNYEPTVNPIASGGYYWVVFTSRRMYGNVLTGDPWMNEDANQPDLYTKKLWVAAIDVNPTPGQDPSHPAFYLPGQELRAGNMRGFWVPDPCRQDGTECENGSQCCNGYCTAGSDGKLVCGEQPNGCAAEFDRCTQASDCCDYASGMECLNGRCQVEPDSVH